MTAVAADLEHVLQGLERAREYARSYRFEITEEYRAMIAQVEAMQCNRPGAERSGNWLGSSIDRRAFFEAFSRK